MLLQEEPQNIPNNHNINQAKGGGQGGGRRRGGGRSSVGRREEGDQGGAGRSIEGLRAGGRSRREEQGGGRRSREGAVGAGSSRLSLSFVWHIGGEAEGHCYTSLPTSPCCTAGNPDTPAVCVENKGRKADPF